MSETFTGSNFVNLRILKKQLPQIKEGEKYSQILIFFKDSDQEQI